MNVKPFLILTLTAGAFRAGAQHAANDTVLKGATIEVLQSYKPQVKQAPKPEWVPQLPQEDTTHPAFTYDVPQQTLYYTYTSQPLRPLALGNDIAPLPFANYIKAGGGNLSTLFLDAGIGGISGSNYETAIHLHHISQKGDIKYQQSSLSGIEADGTLHNDFSDWHAGISAERNQYYYYGYDNNYADDQIRQTYSTIRLCVDTKSRDSTVNLNYHPAIIASLYNARFNASETNIGFNAPVTYRIDDNLDAQVALNADLAQFNTNTTTVNNAIGELLPGLSVHANGFYGHALLGFALGMGGSGYLLPDLLAAFTIPNTKFTISAGWQATLRQNTYEQLTTENPYLSNTYSIMQTRRDEVFGNIQSNIGNHLSFSGRVSYWKYMGLPCYLNDTGKHNEFYIVYDNVNAISFQLAARYKMANTWSAGISGDFYNFYNGNLPYVWGEPNTKIKGDFTVLLFSKLTVTAYLAFLDGIYGRDGNNHTVKLDPIADIGGSAEYQVIPRLSFFVQLDNLLNDRYQRWVGFEGYGINVYGGLRFKF